jgi:hypothetical protein
MLHVLFSDGVFSIKRISNNSTRKVFEEWLFSLLVG